MKTWKIAVGAALILASTTVMAGSSPGTGIAGSKHDFSAPVTTNPTTGAQSGGTSLLQWLNGTSTTPSTYAGPGAVAYIDPATGKQGVVRVQIGLCTKCHTPHQAKIQSLLWNHTLNSVLYSWDDTVTTAGTAYTTFKGDTYKGPTTKCLTCHDGLMASTDGMWFNRQMTYGSKYVAPAGSLDSGHEVAHGATGKMTGTHPVAMPYPYLQAANRYNGVTSGPATAWAEWVSDPQVNDITMYNDDGAGNISRGAKAAQAGIECGSCHDVHNGPRAVGTILVTGQIYGSATGKGGYICNTCHIK